MYAEQSLVVTQTLPSHLIIHFVFDWFAPDPSQRWGSETSVYGYSAYQQTERGKVCNEN